MHVLVDAQTQVVGNPLADAGRVVVVDVGCDAADDRDAERDEAGEKCDAQRMAPDAPLMRPFEPLRQMMLAERIVEHQLQGPGRGEAHGDLEHHRDEHDQEPGPVWLDKSQHEARPVVHGRSGDVRRETRELEIPPEASRN